MRPTPVSGGYVITQSPLIRHGMHAHTSALDRPISQADLDALNSVQETPWRINTRLLDIMTTAWNQDYRLAGLCRAVPTELPPKLEDHVWAAMSPEDKKSRLKTRGEIHAKNMSAEGRQQSLVDCLTVAHEMADYPAIYYPHSRCFRGRIHPIPAVGPQPQGHDLSKSLLQFARGVRLGSDGLFWLCVRLANCAGQDKLPLEERVAWVLERSALIIETAAAPLENLWWGEVGNNGETLLDEPWGALATVLELGEALQMADPDTFISYLPIPQDGACNGIQHLSAMGLDPVGARATNLCAGIDRQDIYEEVAKSVRRQVENDASNGKAEALSWHGKITRKTVKRAVMTTPYGVTDSGIRRQLLTDGFVADGENQSADATYLRDCLVSGLSDTVVSARSIMAWLQTAANSLARAGLPYEFVTPSGSLVRQAYHVLTSDRVITLCGKLRLEEELPEGGLSPRKCALAASPNTIHAFDASHLTLTVNAAAAAGIGSFAMIHDSYGTHAGHTTELGIILRQKFVDIYRANWLERIRDHISSYAPNVELPPLPERGDFDLSQVLDAKFFFS